MSCEQLRPLLHAYLDGELDLSRSLEIESHLAGCASCERIYRGQQVMREAVGTSSLSYQAPAGLRKRVRTAVRQESRASGAKGWPRWAVLGPAALVLLAVLTWGVVRIVTSSANNGLIGQEALSAHMRSLMSDHLTDVTSSDQHTVKPWFAGKLDFSPVVGDWPALGYVLAGGRLDYLGNRTVAALVYRRREHVINLFTWPAPGPDAEVQGAQYQGYNEYHWRQAGMAYWAISDLNATELRQFVQLVQQGAASAPAP